MLSDKPEHEKSKVEANRNETPNNDLQRESSALLSSRPRKWASQPLDLDDDGRYKVAAGNSLSSIAKRALAMRGKSPYDWNAVEQEMDRIVALNSAEHPSLQHNRAFIREGWKLKLWDRTMGADATCEWKQWQEAKPNQWTVVSKCERVLAPEDAWLVVQPGGEAVLNPGAKAFVAPDAAIKMALPGSLVVAVGGEIHDYGATIEKQSSDVRIIKEDASRLTLDGKGGYTHQQSARADAADPMSDPETSDRTAPYI